LARLWVPISWIVILFALILLIETALRILFPWDMYVWSESPFMTNMIKLERHLPIYTSPADGNSFVYSAGLEYLAFAVLKPFGLQMDARWCRLVNVLIGLAGAAAAALAMTHLARATSRAGRLRAFFPVAWGIAALVLFKNFTADVLHPDNIHAFHALVVFWLCFTAAETKRFGLAAIAMALAGLGVLTKQTEALCWLGPAAAFAIVNPWGWRRWFALVIVGGATFAIALYLLWLPPDAKFFTWSLPLQQGVSLRKIYHLAGDLLSMDRAVLFCLALFAVVYFWDRSGVGRRYLICWAAVGTFSVLPNLSAYLKTMGAWNNLILFQDWMILIVWPFLGVVLDSLAASLAETTGPSVSRGNQPRTSLVIYGLTVLYIFLLLPLKLPPRPDHYRYCREVEERVRSDMAAGRKVLVSHGAEFLIRAGSKDIPLDRANSILEMNYARLTNNYAMPSRINSHYYDRIYLRTENWYGERLLEEIRRNYKLESEIKSAGHKALAVLGYQDLMDDCQVWVPRQAGDR
jgi:hypothetical protein